MLLSLRLRDFVIVDAADLEFGEGFTVLTGETGAGKSILLDALGLALGARADASVVREHCPRADISASFRSPEGLDPWLAERALGGDPGIVMLRRIVESDGRSRALINGQPATVSLMREVGERLVDIHGQHSAQSLLRQGAQRALLDASAGITAEVMALADLFTQWQTLEHELAAAQAGGREQALERDRLQWQVSELAALGLKPGDWASLNEEQRRLSHAASLIEGAQGAAEALTDGEMPVSAQLSELLARLRPLAQVDGRLRESVELLDSALIQVDEAASTLASYASRIELDPGRLAEIEQQISAIFSTSRKFRLAVDDIPAELEALAARLAELERAQDIEGLQQRVAAARAVFDKAARKISAARAKAADQLSAGISALLRELGMSGSSLHVALEPAAPGPAGIDSVEFRIAGHAGSAPRPLAKVASGGELSRIGLAIAVLAARANPVPTLIFDEADAGVGGAVAEVIGALMRRLGKDRQVLCVTHLPQVAAQAHQQLKVIREIAQQGALSRVQALARNERVEEIARMLGGVEITATTRKHAREMLAQAG